MRRKILPLLFIVLFYFSYCPAVKSATRKSAFEFINLPYGPNLKRGANLMDLRLPTNGKPPYPVVVLIHGGGWSVGNKTMFPDNSLLANGYATASINYTLSGQGKFPAAIKDCKTAIAWLHTNGRSINLDPDRIAVWGGSAGGHLAALLGTTGDATAPPWAAPAPGTSNKVAAVCDWCGPANLATIDQQATPNNKITMSVMSFLGAHPLRRPDLAKEASPNIYAHKGCPPFFIVHGDQDLVVPAAQSIELSEDLKKQGVDCTLKIIPGGTHAFYSTAMEKEVIDFFDRTLKIKR